MERPTSLHFEQREWSESQNLQLRPKFFTESAVLCPQMITKPNEKFNIGSALFKLSL